MFSNIRLEAEREEETTMKTGNRGGGSTRSTREEGQEDTAPAIGDLGEEDRLTTENKFIYLARLNKIFKFQ